MKIRAVETTMSNVASLTLMKVKCFLFFRMKSFTTMSKFCIRTVYQERLMKCSNIWCFIKYKIFESLALSKIHLFETFLWIKAIFTL